MNLPKIDPKELEEFMEREGDPAVLAILHCLRSIAVNLEVIALFIGLGAQDINSSVFAKGVDKFTEHSVKIKE